MTLAELHAKLGQLIESKAGEETVVEAVKDAMPIGEIWDESSSVKDVLVVRSGTKKAVILTFES